MDRTDRYFGLLTRALFDNFSQSWLLSYNELNVFPTALYNQLGAWQDVVDVDLRSQHRNLDRRADVLQKPMHRMIHFVSRFLQFDLMGVTM